MRPDDQPVSSIVQLLSRVLRPGYLVVCVDWFEFFFTTKSTKDTKGGSEDISLHPVFEFVDSKVEDESDLDVRKLPVGDDLSLMDRINSLLRQR